MNFIILLFIAIIVIIVIIVIYILENIQKENFVQVKSSKSKKSFFIKPIQVIQGYNQSIKKYDDDNILTNSIYDSPI